MHPWAFGAPTQVILTPGTPATTVEQAAALSSGKTHRRAVAACGERGR
jgi:hypothetical protein